MHEYSAVDCPALSHNSVLITYFSDVDVIGRHCAGPRAQARTPRRDPAPRRWDRSRWSETTNQGRDSQIPSIERHELALLCETGPQSEDGGNPPQRSIFRQIGPSRCSSGFDPRFREARLRCSAQPPAATARHLILRPGGCHGRGNQVDGARGNSLASAAPVPRGSRSRPDSLSRATSGIAKG
jgi:hypothetical protein